MLVRANGANDPGYQSLRVSVTAAVPVSSTSSATPDVVASTSDVTGDGATIYEVEFSCPYVAPDTTQSLIVLFQESTNSGSTWTSIGNPATFPAGSASFRAITIRRQRTPAAGATTRWRVACYLSGAKGGNPSIGAGDGIGTDFTPAILTATRRN